MKQKIVGNAALSVPKKLLSIVLSLCMLLSITAGLNVTAYAQTSGDYEYNILDDGTAEITKYTGTDTEIVIPSTFDGCTVTSIGNLAFGGCTSLTSITIPDSVTKISYAAFGTCTSLTNIVIPDSVTSIDDRAFIHCENLTSVTLGNSVTSIGFCAFDNCTSLTSVTIPDSVTKISYAAFDDCYNLKDVYYTGTQEQWNNISIAGDNEHLRNATIHYNYPVVCSHILNDTVVKTPATCTSTGLKTSVCTKCGETVTETIPANGHTPVSANNAVKATCEKDGKNADTKCSTCGVILTTGTKIPATGHTIVTDKAVKATYAKAGKTEGKHCKTCGKVTVAQKSVAKLTVPKITLSSVKSKKSKQITVTWKKNTKVTGYQIQYATDSAFKKNCKTVTVSKNSTTSKTISKLKGKTKYYVRIRAYKVENGKKYYSAWSKAKTVTTKK